MARTFDTLVNIESLRYYKHSNTTWYTRSIVSGDYFDNNAGVGDILYFIMGASLTKTCPTHNLRVNVGTALVATSITLVWEFYNKDNTWQPLTIISDPTNNFTVTGLNTITFDVPDGWTTVRTQALSGTDKPTYLYMMIVRARISAVTSLTEGGANTTDAIQTNNWTITIPNGDSVVPLDLYNDDIAGSWGVITQQDVKSYVCTANINIVSGGSFTIANWTKWQTGTEDKWRTFFKTGDLTLGKKDGSDINEGSSFIYYNLLGVDTIASDGGAITWTGAFNCYNSYFWKGGGAENPGWSGNNYMYNSIFETEQGFFRWYFLSAAGEGEIKNCVFSGPNNTTSRGVYFYAGSIKLENVNIGKGYGYWLGHDSSVLTNTTIGTGKRLEVRNSKTSRFRDCIFEDTLATHFTSTMSNVGIVQYTILIRPVDLNNNIISDFYVKIVDAQSNILYDDIWPAGAKEYSLIIDSWKKDISTITDYNPFEIWISKNGYGTYYSKFTLDNNTRIINTTLHKPTYLIIKTGNIVEVQTT